MRERRWWRWGFFVVGLGLASACVEDSGAAGDYCRNDSMCDEGLICVELACRAPLQPADLGPRVDSGPVDSGTPDMNPSPDLGPDDLGVDLGPEDLGPEDLGAEEDLGPEDMGADEDLGPEDLGA